MAEIQGWDKEEEHDDLDPSLDDAPIVRRRITTTDAENSSVDMSRPRGEGVVEDRMEMRRAAVLQLRKQGGSLRQIAAQIRADPNLATPRYSPGHVSQDLTAALSQIRKETTADAMLLRQLELERLDELQSRFWNKALAGDYLAADKVLSIMDRRAKYLGLHEPTRYEINIEWEKLSRQQIQRIADGEDPYSVVIDAEYRVTADTQL